jgi:geranylgeranyl pyrophosphate synthase
MITSFTLLDPAVATLQQVEDRLSAQVDPHASPFEAALADLISAGGKRLRPRIALLTGAAFSADPAPLLDLAAAVEMLHTASLIHDDLVDGSPARRGAPTLNARRPDGSAVLVGDLAFARLARLMHATRSFPVIDMFTRTMTRMVEGELIRLSGGLLTREDYFRWISAKTAALFELAAGAPALLSLAGDVEFAAACRFGHSLGMAFQVVDDVLDFTGSPSRLGKPVGADLRQGLLTLPALIYLEDHPTDPDLSALRRGESLPEPALQALIDRIRRSPAIDWSLEAARRFNLEALDALSCLPPCPERFALAELVMEMFERDH